MLLCDQNFGVQTVPAPAPIFIGPTDAKRKIRATGLHHLIQRPVQQSLAGEPIVVITKAVNAILSGQGRLLLAHFGHAQIVKPQIRRQARLVVAAEIRRGLGDVGPLGKALAPPAIIFRNRVVLGQVEGDQPHPVERLKGLAPTLQIKVLVALDLLEFVPVLIGRHAQVMDDFGGGLVEDFAASFPHPQRQIAILEIGRRVAFVKTAQLAKQRGFDQEASARTVIHLSQNVVLRFGGIVVEADQIHRAVPLERRARFLQMAARIDQLGPDDTRIRSRVENLQQTVEPAGQDLGVIIQKQQVTAPRLFRASIGGAQKAEIFRVAQIAQPRNRAEQPLGGVAGAIVHHDHLVTGGGRAAMDRSQTAGGVVDLIEHWDDDRNLGRFGRVEGQFRRQSFHAARADRDHGRRCDRRRQGKRRVGRQHRRRPAGRGLNQPLLIVGATFQQRPQPPV